MLEMFLLAVSPIIACCFAYMFPLMGFILGITVWLIGVVAVYSLEEWEMDINSIPLRDQFKVMLMKTRKREIDKEILALDFIEENVSTLRKLFDRRRKYVRCNAEQCDTEDEW